MYATEILEPLAMQGGEPCVVETPSSYLHGPQEIGQEEIDAVTSVLRTKNLFRFFKPDKNSPTAQFERHFAQATHVQHVLAVNSGTSALICAMIGLGVSSGDEVIIPAYTYIATAAAVLACRGIPVIAEVDNSLTLDPKDVERKITSRTKLIVPVHMRGIPCRMKELLGVAQRHQVKLLEDCAQANGGTYQGQPLGSFGDAGAFSFQQFKIITAGEGGAFVTNNRTVYERGACYHDSAYTFWLAGKGQVHIDPFLGENYRLSELNGALLQVQFGKRERILTRLREIKRRLTETVAGLKGIELQDVPDAQGDCGTTLSFFVESTSRAKRFAEALRAENAGNVGTMFDQGIPDRHIFFHWDYILNKRTPDLYGYPWKDPNRPCHVEYSRDMCPQSLGYLERTVVMGLTQIMTDRHVESLCKAIEKVNRFI